MNIDVKILLANQLKQSVNKAQLRNFHILVVDYKLILPL